MFKRLIFVILLVVNIILIYKIIWSDSGVMAYLKVKDEYRKLYDENEKIKLENIRLSNDIRKLKDDKEYLADIIREEMHYVKKNEVIYMFATSKK